MSPWLFTIYIDESMGDENKDRGSGTKLSANVVEQNLVASLLADNTILLTKN